MLAETVHIVGAQLSYHRLIEGYSLSEVGYVVGDMRIVASGTPFPLLSGLIILVLSHSVWQTQVLVEAGIVVIGTAGPQGETLDERHIVNQCGIDVQFGGPGFLVAGFVDGGKRADKETLVVLHGTCVNSIVLDRKIRVHLDGLTGDGEPSCLGITVVCTSGKEGRRLAVGHHAAESDIEFEVFGNFALHIDADVVPVVGEIVDISLLVEDTSGYEVAGLVISSLHGDVVLLVETGAEHEVDIIHIVPAVGRVAIENQTDDIL